MRAFAALLERLVLTPQRNVKLRLMTDYFRATPDPDRGYALAALTGELDIPSVKPAMLQGAHRRRGWTRCCSPIPTTMSATSPRPSR